MGQTAQLAIAKFFVAKFFAMGKPVDSAIICNEKTGERRGLFVEAFLGYRISIFNAFSKRAMVSNVILELPFNRLETYCCVQPISLASSACVTDCSSIARNTCSVI